MEQLTKNIEKAKFDYRDVLMAAEYPIYSDLVGGFDTDEFTEEELNAITEKDLDQYQNWLKA